MLAFILRRLLLVLPVVWIVVRTRDRFDDFFYAGIDTVRRH